MPNVVDRADVTTGSKCGAEHSSLGSRPWSLRGCPRVAWRKWKSSRSEGPMASDLGRMSYPMGFQSGPTGRQSRGALAVVHAAASCPFKSRGSVLGDRSVMVVMQQPESFENQTRPGVKIFPANHRIIFNITYYFCEIERKIQGLKGCRPRPTLGGKGIAVTWRKPLGRGQRSEDARKCLRNGKAWSSPTIGSRTRWCQIVIIV